MNRVFLFHRWPAWIALLAVITLPMATLAAPKADLWQRWQRHDAGSATAVDHSAWDRFLGRYVTASEDGINRIDYAKVGASDKKSLHRYLAEMEGAAVSTLNRDEQRAYWINFYNALTVRLILDHYPVAGIREINISPGFFAIGPWGKKLVRVEGEKISLDDMEHRILRPIWKDLRVHYAVNCAAVGCPNLQRRAFGADTMEAQLDQAARDYVNHPRGARIDDGKLYVSSIYEWFKEDFGDTDRGVIAHLGKFAGPELASRLSRITRITDDDYNWSLNN